MSLSSFLQFQILTRFSVIWWSFLPYMVLDFTSVRRLWWARILLQSLKWRRRPTDWTKRIQQQQTLLQKQCFQFLYRYSQVWGTSETGDSYATLLSWDGTREKLKLLNQVCVSVIRKGTANSLHLEERRWQVESPVFQSVRNQTAPILFWHVLYMCADKAVTRQTKRNECKF